MQVLPSTKHVPDLVPLSTSTGHQRLVLQSPNPALLHKTKPGLREGRERSGRANSKPGRRAASGLWPGTHFMISKMGPTQQKHILQVQRLVQRQHPPTLLVAGPCGDSSHISLDTDQGSTLRPPTACSPKMLSTSHPRRGSED